jgi:hypothetical protein
MMIKIPIEALELARFASRDPSRGNLGWIQFRISCGKATATATDGHRLGRWIWTLAVEEEVGSDGSFYLPAVEVASALRSAAKKDRLFGAELTLGFAPDTDANLKFGALLVGLKCSREITYPDTDQVIPRREQDSLPTGTYEKPIKVGSAIGIDFNYLADVLLWAKACSCRPEMRVLASTEHDPIRIDTENPDCTDNGIFIIMPVRL